MSFFTRHFRAFWGKFHPEVYRFLGLSCRLQSSDLWRHRWSMWAQDLCIFQLHAVLVLLSCWPLPLAGVDGTKCRASLRMGSLASPVWQSAYHSRAHYTTARGDLPPVKDGRWQDLLAFHITRTPSTRWPEGKHAWVLNSFGLHSQSSKRSPLQHYLIMKQTSHALTRQTWGTGGCSCHGSTSCSSQTLLL